MFPSRSWLFLPAYSEKFVLSAVKSKADEVVLDLEDAVPARLKSDARNRLGSAAQTIAIRRKRKPWVRINDVDSLEFLADKEVLIGLPVSGFVVPKAETHAHLEAAEQFLGQDMGLIMLIESARGVEEVFSLASRNPKIVGIMFGHEDYLADIGHWAGAHEAATAFGRARVLNAARALDIFAIDTPYTDLIDIEGLSKVALSSASAGYDGMITLHPRQVETVNDSYSPTLEDLNAARRLVEISDSSGGGVSYIGGTFVAPPLVKRAAKMLERFSSNGLS